MKTRILIMLMAMLPLSFVFANNGGGNHSSKIEGIWQNDYYNVVIKIKDTRKGIKVRKGSYGSWENFDRIGKNTYDNCKGSKIKYDRFARELVIKNRHSRPVTFRKSNGNSRGWSSDSWSSGYGSDYRDDWRNNERRDDRGDRWDDDRNRTNSEYLKGRWYASSHNVEIELKPFNKGIKVKRSGKGKWIKYYSHKEFSNVFVDSKGNVYKLRGDSLIWKGVKLGREIRFYR